MLQLHYRAWSFGRKWPQSRKSLFLDRTHANVVMSKCVAKVWISGSSVSSLCRSSISLSCPYWQLLTKKNPGSLVPARLPFTYRKWNYLHPSKIYQERTRTQWHGPTVILVATGKYLVLVYWLKRDTVLSDDSMASHCLFPFISNASR